MLLDANGWPNALAHTDENNAMETSTTVNVALGKWLFSMTSFGLPVGMFVFFRYAFEPIWMQGRDCISHGVYEISPCQ